MIDPDALDLVLPLADVKLHLKVDGTDEDELIQELVYVAAEMVEGETGHLIGRRMVTESFDRFDRVRLRSFPLHAVTALRYLDSANVEQPVAIDTLRLNATRRPARLVLLSGYWPCTLGQVVVDLDAGYAADDVPHRLRAAMLLLIKDLYDNRGEVSDLAKSPVPMTPTVDRLLQPFRIYSL